MIGKAFLEGSAFVSEDPSQKIFSESTNTVELVRPSVTGGEGLWQLLDRRKSDRRFTDAVVDLDVVSQLLWAQNGARERTRTAPSAGALYPLNTYLLAFAVPGLEPGCYRYDEQAHTLHQVTSGQTSNDFAAACLNQEVCRRCKVALVWTAVPERATRYGERAFRYMFLDAGHIGQNVHLACEALGLGTCMIGAFYDDELTMLVDADGDNEFAVYAAAIGHPVR